MYIMANNRNEAATIINNNDATGKNIINTRKSIIQNAGGEKIDDIKMPDVQRDLQMQAVQQFREKVKNK